jgi:hypothetical protein
MILKASKVSSGETKAMLKAIKAISPANIKMTRATKVMQDQRNRSEMQQNRC